jgi:cytochrome P450
MKENQGFLMYASVIGQIPWAHAFLINNPLLARIMRPMEDWNPVLNFTIKCMKEHAATASEKKDAAHDLITRYHSFDMSEKDMVVNLSTNLFAGTDTTSAAIRAIIYNLCRYPTSMSRLITEIDVASTSGKLSTPITYKEATTHLPYLDATVKESMRLHPSIGMLFERHVPAEGLQVHDHHIPAGTIVGINPWVTSRSSTTFLDPETFNPDRWILSNSEGGTSAEQLRDMESLWEFIFGAGSRKCMGRQLALIEIYKIVPELLRRFSVELVDREKELVVKNTWMVNQFGLICRLTKR